MKAPFSHPSLTFYRKFALPRDRKVWKTLEQWDLIINLDTSEPNASFGNDEKFFEEYTRTVRKEYVGFRGQPDPDVGGSWSSKDSISSCRGRVSSNAPLVGWKRGIPLWNIWRWSHGRWKGPSVHRDALSRVYQTLWTDWEMFAWFWDSNLWWLLLLAHIN